MKIYHKKNILIYKRNSIQNDFKPHLIKLNQKFTSIEITDPKEIQKHTFQTIQLTVNSNIVFIKNHTFNPIPIQSFAKFES